MHTTSLSLLDKIRNDPASHRWQEFIAGYSPMIMRWLRRRGIGEHDAEEILQEVCSVLVRRLPEFERERQGSLRRWLRLTAMNCLRDFRKRMLRHARTNLSSQIDNSLDSLADESSLLSREWDREHNQQLLAILMDRVRQEFRETTWRAFSLLVLEQVSPEDVAAHIGITTNAVFVAKSRVLRRMREEGAGLLEEQ